MGIRTFITAVVGALIAVPLSTGLPCMAVHAESLSREQATRLLFDADAQTRRDAANRLGEVGTAADVPLLLRALRDSDEGTRDQTEQSIWHIWARSGNPEVDKLYAIGVEQMNASELEQSIVTFSRVIGLKPDFAEGWNKRATLYFLVGDLRKSLADCDEVMKRNPYHFGALAGYAQIYMRLGYYERALDYARRAMELNPNMDGVRQIIDVLEQQIKRERNRMI